MVAYYRNRVAISVFDLFTIGVGPSSSHTVGPMRAARRFVERLEHESVLERTAAVRADLYGSLGATGRGHGSDRAVLLGLEGEAPEGVDPDRIGSRVEEIRQSRRLRLGGRHEISFTPGFDLIFHRDESLPLHPNGMRFTALDGDGGVLESRVYYSIGGGFVVNEDEAGQNRLVKDRTPLPFPFRSGDDLLVMGAQSGKAIWEMMLANEQVWRPAAEVRARLLAIWAAMRACVERGCRQEGVLPGGLDVPRRAPQLYRELAARQSAAHDPLEALDWVNLFALAVNEENAAGGRVVTAPTNGAAGIVPAVRTTTGSSRPAPPTTASCATC